MSVISASPTEHRCSCGRTFLNKISLERHQWVTNHQAAEEAPQRDNQETLKAALKVLREKQAVQHDYDVKRRQKRRLRRQLQQLEDQLMDLAGQLVEGCKAAGTSALTVMRFAMMTLVLSGLVVAGMKIGTFLPA